MKIKIVDNKGFGGGEKMSNDNYIPTYTSDTKIGDKILIVNARKPYLNNGEIYEVVGHTEKMNYPYVLVKGVK